LSTIGRSCANKPDVVSIRKKNFSMGTSFI
jgi:hypothetical protein